MINSVQLVGNLTRDPEVRYANNGNPVVNMGIAVNERKKQGDEWVDSPSFFEMSWWGSRAEKASQYLAKGSKVAVSGKLQQQVWESNGKRNSKVIILISELDYMSKKPDLPRAEPGNERDFYDSDIPF